MFFQAYNNDYKNNMNLNQNNMNLMMNNQNIMNMLMNQNNMNTLNQNNMNVLNQNPTYNLNNSNIFNMHKQNNNFNYMNINQNNLLYQNYLKLLQNMMMNQNNMANMNNFNCLQNCENNFMPNINMQNSFGNINNGINNNYKFLMQNLFDQVKTEDDPYKIQKVMSFCMNNNKPYEKFVSGGKQMFTTSSNDESNDNNEDMIQIVFVSMKGNKHIRKYNKNEEINSVLQKFVEGFGLNKNALKKIYFLYNAANLNSLKENTTLKDANLINNSRINVIDINNIIGA